jgi:hypothetical protein
MNLAQKKAAESLGLTAENSFQERIPNASSATSTASQFGPEDQTIFRGPIVVEISISRPSP